MSASNSPEQAPASNRNQPNEPHMHSNQVLLPSVIISSIQIDNSQTSLGDLYVDPWDYDMPAESGWDTNGRNTIPRMLPLSRPSLPPLTATVPTHAPALAQPTLVTAGPSIPLRLQNASISRAPNPFTFHAQPISRNYRGNHLSVRNQSANIPPEQSTSVWITNLPPNCNYAELLGMVQDAGKVYAAVISPPDDKFITSAAKIVFFDLEGRQRFEARANAGQFAVGAYVPRVRPNRILTEAQPVGPESRVLHITGPDSIVNQHVLLDYFRRWCAFDIEYVQRWQLEDRNASMVWAFASYRCQAERVYAAIRDIKAYNLHSPGRGFWDSVVRCGREPYEADCCSSVEDGTRQILGYDGGLIMYYAAALPWVDWISG
ncbi:hypothetical protein FHL15_001958 [Xylaria flabelliformis]|uniref:RRM domain-containing protein n=1 Tax=Xylaria flabelliformis TaxID=2512241 RepID=A0A553IAE3_9PEZI|nr:hypothetical protein FHL15_001958 [Xylaria flabelliformis]